MCANTQGLLNKLPTLAAYLCRETRVHPNHLMSSILSFGFKNGEKRTPRGVHDGLRQVMVFHHVGDLKVFNDHAVIAFRIGFRRLEMMIAALPIDLEMGFRYVLCGLTASVTAFLPAAHLALFAPERSLRRAIETRILHRVAFAISQEGFEAHVNADVRMRTGRGKVFGRWFRLTDNESIPVSISTQDQMHGFRSPFYWTVQLQLEGLSEFRRNMQVFVICIQPRITGSPILPQLDRVPAIGCLEAREPDIRNTQLLRCEKPLERLGEAISEHLYRGGWHMLTTTAFELCRQIILRGERALLCILALDGLQHLIVEVARRNQTLHEQVGLLPIHEKAILKCSHTSYCTRLGFESQQFRPPAGGRPFTPLSEARGPLAALR